MHVLHIIGFKLGPYRVDFNCTCTDYHFDLHKCIMQVGGAVPYLEWNACFTRKEIISWNGDAPRPILCCSKAMKYIQWNLSKMVTTG